MDRNNLPNTVFVQECQLFFHASASKVENEIVIKVSREYYSLNCLVQTHGVNTAGHGQDQTWKAYF